MAFTKIKVWALIKALKMNFRLQGLFLIIFDGVITAVIVEDNHA